jgi:thiosulfate/3-mercaptopyruvate sulfurtransferase
MMLRSLLRTALPLLFAGRAVAGQLPTGPRLLVDARSVNAQLHEPDLVILIVGPDGGYAKAHIPGSRFIKLNDLSTPMGRGRPAGTLTLEMPSEVQLREAFEARGISNSSRIVVVADSEWNSLATRVVLTLGYVGLGDRTALLDGGMTAWEKAGYPVTADVPTVAPGHLTTTLMPSLIVNADYMTAHRSAPHVRLIDARDSVFYTQPATADGRPGGHIPGAASLPFGSLLEDSSNVFFPRSTLEAKFRAAGVAPGDTVVAYCHVGGQATLVLLAAQLLGHPVKLYDGSFQDWALRKLPTEGAK